VQDGPQGVLNTTISTGFSEINAPNTDPESKVVPVLRSSRLKINTWERFAPKLMALELKTNQMAVIAKDQPRYVRELISRAVCGNVFSRLLLPTIYCKPLDGVLALDISLLPDPSSSTQEYQCSTH
jgi:hypothetical protein